MKAISQRFSELGKTWRYSLSSISKSQFSVSSKYWEKSTIPARATFKNLNFQFLCELGKTWKYSLSSSLKTPNFKSEDELGKVMS